MEGALFFHTSKELFSYLKLFILTDIVNLYTDIAAFCVDKMRKKR